MAYVYYHHYLGFKCLQPPPLPSNYVNRQILLDEIVTKLLQATNDPNKDEATLIITGAGGFGKTTTVVSLGHHPLVKEQFTDGFVFIELGPQASDPSIKLKAVYNLLTDEHCDITVVEQTLKQLTNDYYRNLLVVIDDVWHVEDAEPLVRAFSNCKTILTTRMNDIEKYIPCEQSVTIGPMTKNEAISLLTSGVIDSSQLSQEDVSLLDELAQDVHLWPLLLSLIRGHLSHNLKYYHLSYRKAFENVRVKLHDKGLTAFDKNTTGNLQRFRRLAVKACIDMTLELLTKSLSDKVKTLILWTGIGSSLQTAALNDLWNISEQAVHTDIEILWGYGLVQFTEITIYPNNSTQQCVEVHAVISQYIIECMDSNEAFTLAPIFIPKAPRSIFKRLELTFKQSYGVDNPLQLTATDYLKYKLSEIENFMVPYCLRAINMYTVVDPHYIIQILQKIKHALMVLPYTINMFSSEIDLLIVKCKQILKDVHKLCRKLNQSVQRILHLKDYDKLIQAIQEFMRDYQSCNVAQKAVKMVKSITNNCYNSEVISCMVRERERLQVRSADYHVISETILPYLKLHVNLHKRITSSLQNGSPDIELTYHYILFGKFTEEYDLVSTNRIIKLQDVTPVYAYVLALQQ